MAYTDNSEIVKHKRAKKMMLWFAMISMVMSFAGLTSAYIVSKSRPDWINDFTLPQAFYYSFMVVILSSITMIMARAAIKNEKHKKGLILLIVTFLLGLLFVNFQISGFNAIVSSGYFFTGSESSITTTFIYLIVLFHMAHVLAGLIVLLVVIYNHYKQKYTMGQTLGIELAETFWHFVGILWIYLFLFFYFFR